LNLTLIRRTFSKLIANIPRSALNLMVLLLMKVVLMEATVQGMVVGVFLMVTVMKVAVKEELLVLLQLM
jgi:hypothetical protein